MRINFRGNIVFRMNSFPIFSNKIIDINDIVTNISLNLSSIQYQILFVDYSSMTFKSYLFSITSIVQLLPDVLLTVFGNIHFIKIFNETLVYIIASMNIKVMAENSCDMIGSVCNIFSLNFNLGPAVVEGIF